MYKPSQDLNPTSWVGGSGNFFPICLPSNANVQCDTSSAECQGSGVNLGNQGGPQWADLFTVLLGSMGSLPMASVRLVLKSSLKSQTRKCLWGRTEIWGA